jgi:hypothetical protein
MGLNEVTEPSPFRFDSGEDVLDNANEIVQNSKRWLARHNLNFVEGYVKGQFQLAIHCVASKEGAKFYCLLNSPCLKWLRRRQTDC